MRSKPESSAGLTNMTIIADPISAKNATSAGKISHPEKIAYQ